ncbi:type II toxin-antitoxin system RelE/ParE family toxin [Youngiibacter fragilis]|uniref:Plasmid stabilization protein n=1 Tax=Youngiibacter fragilis 232.1 TaxID=994573 RepID=V7I7V5_9CLOT|nr:type II toxin-antitoxin system RelE/ParE family toxin [Youngiibacter fragilis]ETA81356.1 plasmid stabilization protein [Youngiibacter fragilis 232.1]
MLPVTYMPIAEKYFRKIKDSHLKSAYKTAIIRICENPYIGKAKTGDLSGIFSLDIYYNGTNCQLTLD